MRKKLVKEVTVTTARIGELKLVDGEIKAVELKPVRLLGKISKEKAQQIVSKDNKKSVMVFEVTTETNQYEMDVFDFMKHAKPKQEEKPETKKDGDKK